MRTLKKTLCLVLCLAMMAGLCCVAASADFNDAEEIVNKEAVDVLTGIGVINGIEQEDGTFDFDPTGTLTRAQACKIITFLMRDEDLGGTCSFTDCQGHWAESYIAYCANAGIVAGYGDGTFGPDAKLTGAAWAKMLLCALGYKAENEGMVGADWEIAVAKLAKQTGLTYGLKKFDGAAEISRDDACLLAFNALYISEVYYKADGITIKTEDVEITAGASAAESTGDCLYELFDLDWDSYRDDYGRWVNVAFEDADNDGDYDAKETVYASFVEEPVLVLKGAFTCGDLYNKLGLKASKSISFNAPGLGASGTVTAAKGSTDPVGLAGDTVEVYYSEYSDSYSMIIIDTKLAVVTAADIVKTDGVQTGTKIGGIETKSIYAVNSVVLYELANGKIHNDRLATVVTAKATANNATKGTVKVDGVTYNKARNSAPSWIGNLTGELNYYVDENNNVYGSEGIYVAEVGQTNFVYVVKFVEQAYVDAGTDVLNPLAAKAASVKAEVIFTDGTHKAIDLALVGANAAAKFAKPAADGTVTANSSLTTGTTNVNNWFAYTEKDDGTYVLAAVDSHYGAVASSTVTLTKNTVRKDLAGKYTNSAMKVVSIAAGTYAVTEKTGLVDASLVSSSSTHAVLVTFAKNSNTITAIYAVNQAGTAPVATYTGLAYAVAAGDTVADGVEWSFYENGALVTYVVDDTVVAGNVYKLTKNPLKNVYSAGAAVVTDVKATSGSAVTVTVADSAFFADGTNEYFYQTNTVVCNVTKGHTGESDTLQVGDKVVVYTDGGKVAAVYIVAEAPVV